MFLRHRLTNQNLGRHPPSGDHGGDEYGTEKNQWPKAYGGAKPPILATVPSGLGTCHQQRAASVALVRFSLPLQHSAHHLRPAPSNPTVPTAPHHNTSSRPLPHTTNVAFVRFSGDVAPVLGGLSARGIGRCVLWWWWWRREGGIHRMRRRPYPTHPTPRARPTAPHQHPTNNHTHHGLVCGARAGCGRSRVRVLLGGVRLCGSLHSRARALSPTTSHHSPLPPFSLHKAGRRAPRVWGVVRRAWLGWWGGGGRVGGGGRGREPPNNRDAHAHHHPRCV